MLIQKYFTWDDHWLESHYKDDISNMRTCSFGGLKWNIDQPQVFNRLLQPGPSELAPRNVKSTPSLPGTGTGHEPGVDVFEVFVLGGCFE